MMDEPLHGIAASCFLFQLCHKPRGKWGRENVINALLTLDLERQRGTKKTMVNKLKTSFS